VAQPGTATGWRLENGQQIEARTLVSFYEPRGEFQLNVDAIRRAGQGDLFERFQQLKEKLEKREFLPLTARPYPVSRGASPLSPARRPLRCAMC
jgi:exodeoxyribonuclease VII large subunit